MLVRNAYKCLAVCQLPIWPFFFGYNSCLYNLYPEKNKYASSMLWPNNFQLIPITLEMSMVVVINITFKRTAKQKKMKNETFPEHKYIVQFSKPASMSKDAKKFTVWKKISLKSTQIESLCQIPSTPNRINLSLYLLRKINFSSLLSL